MLHPCGFGVVHASGACDRVSNIAERYRRRSRLSSCLPHLRGRINPIRTYHASMSRSVGWASGLALSLTRDKWLPAARSCFPFAISAHTVNMGRDRSGYGAPDAGQAGRPVAHRSWAYANNADSSGTSFTMMSYNILSDALLYQNHYLYTGCDSRVLKWRYRFERLFTEIRHYAPSILCIQEVDKVHWDSFVEELAGMGFQGYFCGRTGSKPDGCALFWYAQPTSLP